MPPRASDLCPPSASSHSYTAFQYILVCEAAFLLHQSVIGFFSLPILFILLSMPFWINYELCHFPVVLVCRWWYFISGLYLFLQVQCPLSLVNIKYKHFIMIGCGEWKSGAQLLLSPICTDTDHLTISVSCHSLSECDFEIPKRHQAPAHIWGYYYWCIRFLTCALLGYHIKLKDLQL